MAHLRDVLLTEGIRETNRERRSGVLSVTAGEVTKALFFRAGQVVFASSTLEEDKLGESLIRLGRISRREFAVAYEAARLRKRRLGQTLVAAGVATEEELGRLLASQVQSIALSLFTWTQGEMHFTPAQDPIPADLAVDLSTHRLLFEGARVYPDPGRLERALGDPRRSLRRAASPPFDSRNVSFSPAERDVLAAAEDGISVVRLLAGPGTRSLLVRATYALVAGGLLESAASPAPFEEDTGTFRLALPVEPVSPPPDRRAQILALYEALPRATHYHVLGVSLDATPRDIEEASQRLEREEDEWREFADDVRLASLISTLRFKRREAHRVLTDPPSRARYDRKLGALAPAATPPPDAPAAPPPPDVAKLRREAIRLLDQGKVDDAVTRLLEAVEQSPHDKDANRLLALALAQHPTLFRSAERHFVAALELDPRDVELRFCFAQFYKRTGLPARALVQLHALLAMAPDHPEAQREMKALQEG
jgi:tetratricopeptide (TPR) repeat protein